MNGVDRVMGQVLRIVPITCFAALFVLILINVIARTFQLAGFAWFDEVVQGLFAWMVFVGAAALWREQDHFYVQWLTSALPPRASRALCVLIAALGLCFLCVMTWFGAYLALRARALTPILDLPTSLFYAAIPISGAVMIAYSLADLFCLLNRKDTSQ